MDVEVVETDTIDADTRTGLRTLWTRAFGSRFTDADADHAYGGVHVLVRDSGRIIGHAAVVPRPIKFGDQPWRTVGYVEAVATDPERQGDGVGRRVMEHLQVEISSRWGVALLSTGRATGFYEALGWERWLGLSFTQLGGVAVPDGEHGGLMVFCRDRALMPPRTLAVTCQDRAGDAW